MQKLAIYGPPEDDDDLETLKQKIARRYEQVGHHIITFFIFGGVFVFITCILLMKHFYIFAILYIGWIYVDRKNVLPGSRRLKFMRKLKFWKFRRNYFPVKMVKTAEIPADRSYIFGCFPHGIIPFGSSTNLLSDVNAFDQAFPNLNVYMVTLEAITKIPVTREIISAFGFIDANPWSLSHILSQGNGNVCCLYPGGAAEALLCNPGVQRLLLKNRKGFVKLALKNGSGLVPVYTFGENNTLFQPQNDNYRKWQKWMYDKYRFPLIKVKGANLFSENIFYFCLRFVPVKHPLITIIGQPILVPKVENPSQELIDEYHGKFIDQILEIFNTFKGEYDVLGEEATISIE